MDQPKDLPGIAPSPPPRPRRARTNPRRHRAWIVAAAFGLGLAVFVFYFLVYRTRHVQLPLGFDSSWYVWRARYAASRGVGPLGTSVRPGHEVLSAMVGALTGRSQLTLTVILPLVLVSVFALALGGLWAVSFQRRGWEWTAAVAVGGTLLGTTRLVGENVANLMNLTLVTAAVAFLAWRLAGRRGLAGAVVLLVGAGLAHWVFLAVFGLVWAVAFALFLPGSLRARRGGAPLAGTEAGLLAASGLGTAAAMTALVAGVLRAPFQTFEIREDPRRFRPKMANDLRAAVPWALGPVALAGGLALAGPRRDPAEGAGRRRRFVLVILCAWVAVCLAGIGYGAITLDVPPHRFLALLVAGPLALGLVGAVRVLAEAVGRRWGGRRGGASVAVAVAAVAVAALAVPGAVRWYRGGPGEWIGAGAFREALTAARYVQGLPPGRPVVFVVDPKGDAGLLSAALKERTIRMAMPPSRQQDVHVFVGQPEDLLAGRRTRFRGVLVNEAVAPFWRDVMAVLAQRPVVLMLRAMAPTEFASASGTPGAEAVGDGIAVLRGPAPATSLPAAALPRPVPRVRSGILYAGVILLALGVAGLGWTRALAGPGLPPEAVAALAPSMGMAVLMMAGVVPARLGLGMGGAAGIVTYAAVTAAGFVAALRWGAQPGEPSSWA